MLTRWGVPFLVWLDDELVPEAVEQLARFGGYVRAWRVVLLGSVDTPPGVL